MGDVKESIGDKTKEAPGLFDGLSVEEAQSLFDREESSKVAELAKGEKVGYAELGAPGGAPVLFLPGVGVGRMIGVVFHQFAQQLNIRLISVDRPGIGLSSDHDEEPRTKEFCRRLREFASILGIEKFHMMGHSAGGIYSMAASVFLKDILLEPVVLFAPWMDPTAYSGTKATVRFAANYLPSSWITFGSKVNGAMLWSFGSSAPTLMKAQMSKEERQSVSTETGGRMLRLVANTLGQGETSGMAKDVLLCLGRSGGAGFSPEELTLKTITFHGTQDDTVPLAAIKSFEASTGENVSVRVIHKGTHNICMNSVVVHEALRAVAPTQPAQ